MSTPARATWPELVGDVLTAKDVEKPAGLRRLHLDKWLRQLRIEPPDDVRDLLALCDSGPEVLYAWQCAKQEGTRVDDGAFVRGAIALRPQVRSRLYRIDFIATAGDVRLAIEIDGYAWHQATEEQVERDYLRQRRLTHDGFRVVRFTAREALSRPEECWRQTKSILEARRRG